jgi:H+/Cl- antiporter ClcA
MTLGPEAPLIALGGGLAVVLVRLVRRDAPPQLLAVVGAAGSFAAISVIFESPIIAAVLVIEATGLGGAALPVVLLPGLLAAGVGSLVFIGFSSVGGLDTSAYSLAPLSLPVYEAPTWGGIFWSLVIAVIAAVIGVGARHLGLLVLRAVRHRPAVVVPFAGIGIGTAGIVFALATDESARAVLFSGQAALPELVAGGSTLAVGTLLWLAASKAVAWVLSMGAFRGGPTFPALFLGATVGVLLMHAPGMAEGPAVAVGMGALMVAVLKLPLSSIVVATLLTASSGAGTAPLVVVGVVAAYVLTLVIEWRLASRAAPAAG